ncbi:MAG: hypothetical protein ABI759_11695 [Candidatus Solibacter sp.]
MHIRRTLAIAIAMCATLPLSGQVDPLRAEAYERLAATSKLWAYIKYVHPRVTSPGVDWDAAFVRVAPKVLDAKTESEFAAAVAISQSEHSGLFYRTANGTVFIGSPTQGANGDVTYFMAPGGIRINFSGHDVRWPDGKQLQRVGLLPDIEVRPTIAGIQSARDEVLERAVAYLEKGK